jgi:hypothetical protein
MEYTAFPIRDNTSLSVQLEVTRLNIILASENIKTLVEIIAKFRKRRKNIN